MLGAAIVPEGDGIGLPVEPAGKFRRVDVVIEVIENGLRFLAGHAAQAITWQIKGEADTSTSPVRVLFVIWAPLPEIVPSKMVA